ncbi:MAG: hypothetical protein U0Q15_13935 [Kineosporiaceae bacterium]
MTGALISIAIVLGVVGITGAVVISYFRLQRHRADAVAHAAFRQLAEQAVANQQALQQELSVISSRLEAVETLLRSVE